MGRFFNIDEFRHGIERMDPAHYLGSSYYERWLDGLARVLIEKGVVTPEELEERAASFRARPEAPAPGAEPGSRGARIPDDADGRPSPLNFAPPSSGRDPRRASGPRSSGARLVTRSSHPPGQAMSRSARRARQSVPGHEAPRPRESGRSRCTAVPLRHADPDALGRVGGANHQVHLDLWESYLRSADDRP